MNDSIVISSRIRLARNIKKYPFADIISSKQSEELIDEAKLISHMKFNDMSKLNDTDKQAMIENNIISYDLINRKKPCGLLTSENSDVSVMVNEEDHLRIQAVCKGFDIDKAYKEADEIDNLFSNNTEYAFDENLGYLTTCLSNVGTGLRASFMIHIPMIEYSGQIPWLTSSISKFGMVLRGIYGEGSKPLGGIYQISNEITLGKSEEEIIESIKTVTSQISENEMNLRKKYNDNDLKNKIYRSYGILKYGFRISSEEASELLSNVQTGKTLGLKDIDTPDIYSLIREIQPANMIRYINKNNISEKNRDIVRAEYIKNKM